MRRWLLLLSSTGIQMQQATAENISAAMIAIGLPVTRIEHRDNGTHYFYRDAKSRRGHCFWISEKEGQVFWNCGLSSSAKKIAEGFAAAGLFIGHENRG